jgi:hypothetical protein
MEKKKLISDIYKEISPEFSLWNFYRRIKLFWLEEAIKMWKEQVYHKVYDYNYIIKNIIKSWRKQYDKKALRKIISVYIWRYEYWFIDRVINKLINSWHIQYEDWSYNIIDNL